MERLTSQPPRTGEVLVKIEAVGVCRSDWQACTGAAPYALLVALGHEGAGSVVETGSGDCQLHPGDRMVLNWVPACGKCFYCQLDRPGLSQDTKATVWVGVMQDGSPRLTGSDDPWTGTALWVASPSTLLLPLLLACC